MPHVYRVSWKHPEDLLEVRTDEVTLLDFQVDADVDRFDIQNALIKERGDELLNLVDLPEIVSVSYLKEIE